MLRAGVRLGLDNVEGPIHREVKGQVSLRVIGERQLLSDVWSVFTGHGPFLNLNLLASFKLVRFVDA